MTGKETGGALLWKEAGEEARKPGGKRGLAREADDGDGTPTDQGGDKSRPEKVGRDKETTTDGCRLAATTEAGPAVAVADKDGEAAEENAGRCCGKEAAAAEVCTKESMASIG